MGTPADKLAYLKATKEAIKNAIKGKGQTVADNATFRSYADKIAAIETGSKPTITVSSSGLITATSGNFSNTKQLATQGTKTWTPGASAQGINAGTYVTGYQTILGDSDLVASNIKKDVQIFGVTGTYGFDITSSVILGSFITKQTADGEVKITFDIPAKRVLSFNFEASEDGRLGVVSARRNFVRSDSYDFDVYLIRASGGAYSITFDEVDGDPYSIVTEDGWGSTLRNNFNFDGIASTDQIGSYIHTTNPDSYIMY